MGQISKRLPEDWKRHGVKDSESLMPIGKPPAQKAKLEDKPKVRYFDDGVWTTQHPTATAFSLEWFQIHLAMAPYCLELLKMAFLVSKSCLLTVAVGTVVRAFVDATQLYAYTRFVNEVLSMKLTTLT
jgi:hypothetical protein